ncbi:hypothetical protein BDK51DRAFT_37621 [Blyttiomyces helicus]|uniref:Uncharacterized protein n=1 Tax=Blyttiomyces helicus TaxID=388810 RepID=A0A4P9VU05_9FUNG|nr:hypothetical protein BDK51DRAFT_37621 [Blyttiomyces helicus]|eukprot:RKO83039.1 hypothetical protein BDK51DRAFT_37621 [Blyttiomyces helicus]
MSPIHTIRAKIRRGDLRDSDVGHLGDRLDYALHISSRAVSRSSSTDSRSTDRAVAVSTPMRSLELGLGVIRVVSPAGDVRLEPADPRFQCLPCLGVLPALRFLLSEFSSEFLPFNLGLAELVGPLRRPRPRAVRTFQPPRELRLQRVEIAHAHAKLALKVRDRSAGGSARWDACAAHQGRCRSPALRTRARTVERGKGVVKTSAAGVKSDVYSEVVVVRVGHVVEADADAEMLQGERGTIEVDRPMSHWCKLSANHLRGHSCNRRSSSFVALVLLSTTPHLQDRKPNPAPKHPRFNVGLALAAAHRSRRSSVLLIAYR